VRRAALRALALPLLLGAASVQGAPVRVGLERCDVPGGGPLEGRRIGLVCHAASVTEDGRRAVDVLRTRGVTVVRLFAPEHGLAGKAAAGVAIDESRDEATGLAVVSLYGAKRRPDPGDLAGLDALVIDLQDAGVRFYTYAATMLGCMEAAADANLPVFVLDRPNPLGGEQVEGPLVDLPEKERTSLSRLPGTLVHGLTLGEMARFEASRSPRLAGLKLIVVPLEGWTRTMRWSDTGRPWVAPSPNLRSADAALVYPGVALLEATNVSEGRGSEAPFQLFGAPWLSLQTSARLRDLDLPGIALEGASFTPRASEAAGDPPYEGESCEGFRVKVTNGGAIQPYALGLRLVAALASDPAFRWRDGGRALDRILGTTRVSRAFAAGRSVDDILAGDAAAIEAFKAERRPILLY
jgi:uncharacterized protein YbbC (DUF1343 family)